MPCARQAATTFDWSRKGCISIWLQTSGSLASRTASSISATVKFDTPMWRASPACLTLHRARRASRRAECAGSASAAAGDRPRQPQPRQAVLGGAFELARGKMRRPDLGDDEHLVALDAGGAQPLPDLALVVVHLGGVDVAIAEPQRLLDDARAGAPAQVPGAETDERDAGAVALLRPARSTFHPARNRLRRPIGARAAD